MSKLLEILECLKKGKKDISKEEKEYFERYSKILENRYDEVKDLRIAEKIDSYGEIPPQMEEEEISWIEENWGVKVITIGDRRVLIPGIDTCKRDYDNGKEISEKQLKMIESFYSYPSEITFKNRHCEVIEELKEIFPFKKKVIVNDVGYGAEDKNYYRNEEKFEEDPHFWGARQPWEIIDALEESGKKVDYNGYDFYPEKAKKTQEEITEKYEGKAKFSELDIVSAIPSKRSDITVCLKTLMYVNEEHKEFAHNNLIDSTKKGGYIIIDEVLENPNLKLIKELKINGNEMGYVYKKTK